MGLELGSGRREEHTQERRVPEPGVMYLRGDVGEEQFGFASSIIEDDREALGVLPPFPPLPLQPSVLGTHPAFSAATYPEESHSRGPVCTGPSAEPHPSHHLWRLRGMEQSSFCN